MMKREFETFLDSNIFYTVEELEELYDYSFSKMFTNSLIIKDEELFNTYKNSNLVEFNIQGEQKYISRDLIHDILGDIGMYKYLLTNLNNPYGIAIRIDYIVDKDLYYTIKITKTELIEAIKVLNPELKEIVEQIRIATVNAQLHLYSCEQRYRTYIHRCMIEGERIEIPASIIMEIISSNDIYNKVDEISSRINIKKEFLVYATVDFLERERIFNNFSLSPSIMKNYESLTNFSVVDYESLNKNRISHDINRDGNNILSEVEISDELYDALNREKKSTYSKLEQVIYYYIKLCELLTFNKEYFLDKKEIHPEEELERIKTITPTNNEVITYEFVLIFTKILSDLDIIYSLDQTILAGINEGANKLSFKFGEFLVSLNSIDTIGSSDLTNVKVNDRIIDLVCTNQQEVTQIKFKELVEKIYMEIMQEKQKQENFEISLAKYKEKYLTKETSIREKLFILLKEIGRSSLKGLDIISYTKKIFNCLFKENENIKVNFICANRGYITPISIISVIEGDNYTYFIVDPDSDQLVKTYSVEQMKDLIESNAYKYLRSEPKIPGLENVKGETYAR